MTGPDYAARATAGAAFLDEQVPRWAEQIDLGQLDMGSRYRCVLGQLCGNYEEGLGDFNISDDAELSLGFMRLAGNGGHAWNLLNDAWADEIGKRREPAQVTP